MSTLTLAATGVYFLIKAPNNNNAVIQQWETQDGRPKGRVTGSGHLAFSGSAAINRNAPANSSGGLTIYGKAKICFGDTDGAGYTLCTFTNGTQLCRVAAAAECPVTGS